MHPKFFRFILVIIFPKYYLVSSGFIDNVISQVDIIPFSVGIEICGSNICQFLNAVENSIVWCIHIKSNLFDHILTFGKHLRCNFDISVKEIPEDDVDGIIYGVGVVISQGSDVFRVNICDDFLS